MQLFSFLFLIIYFIFVNFLVWSFSSFSSFCCIGEIGMSLLDMHKIVDRTWRKDLPEKDRLANAALGLAGECGEVIELLKKHLYHGHELQKEKLLIEIGDVYYYLAALEIELGYIREQAEMRVQEKLKARYPEGFSADASKNRPPEQ
jgi:NTP pyrophosphatase (non-canonical NTP hydrolase)